MSGEGSEWTNVCPKDERGPLVRPCSRGAGQLAAEALERITGRGRRHLRVDLHREGDAAVTQDGHRDARVDVECDEEAGAGSPC